MRGDRTESWRQREKGEVETERRGKRAQSKEIRSWRRGGAGGGVERDRQTDRVRGDRTERGEVETERRGERAQNIDGVVGGGGGETQREVEVETERRGERAQNLDGVGRGETQREGERARNTDGGWGVETVRECGVGDKGGGGGGGVSWTQ